MKKVFLFLQVVLLKPASADCNLNLTIASGKYIEELEKAKVTKYQNNSVCEVLDYEIGKCSASQMTKVAKAFNVKEVHRNFCQPHLPPPQGALDKDQFMKGAELYSWKDFQGFHWYALLPGTNRKKSTTEVLAAKSNEWSLQEKLKQLPPQTEISWNNLALIDDQQNLEFSVPSQNVIREVTTSAVSAKLKLEKPNEREERQ